MKPRVQAYGTKNTCGARIEALRKNQQMSQAYMVQQMRMRGAGINESSYSKLEGQIRACTAEELHAIAQVLGVRMEDLLG